MSFAQYCISMPPSLVYPAESLSRNLQSAPSDSSLAEAKVTDLLKVSLDELKGEGNAARSRASESKSVLNLMKYFIRGLADVYGMQDEVDHEGLEKKVRFYFIFFFWGEGDFEQKKRKTSGIHLEVCAPLNTRRHAHMHARIVYKRECVSILLTLPKLLQVVSDLKLYSPLPPEVIFRIWDFMLEYVRHRRSSSPSSDSSIGVRNRLEKVKWKLGVVLGQDGEGEEKAGEGIVMMHLGFGGGQGKRDVSFEMDLEEFVSSVCTVPAVCVGAPAWYVIALSTKHAGFLVSS